MAGKDEMEDEVRTFKINALRRTKLPKQNQMQVENPLDESRVRQSSP